MNVDIKLFDCIYCNVEIKIEIKIKSHFKNIFFFAFANKRLDLYLLYGTVENIQELLFYPGDSQKKNILDFFNS